MSVCVTIIERSGHISSFVMEKDEVTLGRSSSNDLRFDADRYEQISRRHARIFKDLAGFSYEDYDSKHGSWIDGVKVEGTRALNYGETVMVGKDGPVVCVTWPQMRVTGRAGTYLQFHLKSTPYFPLAFSDGFFGTYDKYEKIAAGGFGEIWRAHPMDGSPDVAIKLLNPALLDPDNLQSVDRTSLVKRFVREARLQYLLAESNVPGMVKVHSWGDDPDIDYLYIIMDLVDGKSFDRVIIASQQMEPSRAVRYMCEVARALEAAHNFEFEDENGNHCRGVVHRDVKPNNILIRRVTDEAVLLDFGVAGILDGGDRLTAANITVGTLHYLPPESLRKGQINPSADLWGFAVTFYLALTGGRFPYDGKSRQELLTAMTANKMAPLRAHRLDIDPTLASAIERSLHHDPENRIQTAAEWVALLGNYAGMM